MRFVKPTWLNSLGVKIILAHITGIALSIALLALVAFWWLFAQSHYFVGRNVADLTEELAEILEFDPAGMPVGFKSQEEMVLAWIFDSLQHEIAYRVFNESGQLVLVSAAGQQFWQDIGITHQYAARRWEFEHSKTFFYGSTATVQHNEQRWYFQLAISGRLHYLIHQIVAFPLVGIGVAWFSLILLFMFGVCSYLTLRYTLKPLKDLSESAAAISPRSLHTRLGVEKVPSEIVPLVNSFNNVLDRLERGYRTQQDFLATAAHELKTPLALLRAQIEVREKADDCEALLTDVEHMSRQVQQLLLLAEVSEEQNYVQTHLDVAEVVKEVIAYLNPMALAAGVQLTVTRTGAASWQADSSALFVLLKNLMENAIQHAPRGTDVCCEINSRWLTIRDWGPGVDEEQLSKIFLRFWRGAHRRDHGAGLGLAICQEIAQAHGWILSVRRSEPGLCFRLSLPTLGDAM